MPRRDGTGPLGEGPMTGRAAGYCAGYDTPAPGTRTGRGRGAGLGLGLGLGLARGVGRGLGRGLGLGRGRGLGSRNRFYATGRTFAQERASIDDTLSEKEEASLLKDESQRLRSVLERIEQRLDQLSADKK